MFRGVQSGPVLMYVCLLRHKIMKLILMAAEEVKSTIVASLPDWYERICTFSTGRICGTHHPHSC